MSAAPRQDLLDELTDVIITAAVTIGAVTDGGANEARSHFKRRLGPSRPGQVSDLRRGTVPVQIIAAELLRWLYLTPSSRIPSLVRLADPLPCECGHR